MTYAIEVNNLRKSYGKHEVLKGLHFQVKKNEIFGILGVNGAGKTTTLECLEGFRKYDCGEIQIHGNMGIQLQSASLPEYIRVNEVIQLFARWNKTSIDLTTLASLGITELFHRMYLELSTGQKRRLHLALALLKHPDILFLDEPTAGLDVEGRVSLHQMIQTLQKHGTTIIIASHDMQEVETLCNRIAILNHGEIAFLGTTEELASKIGKHYLLKIYTEEQVETFPTDNIAESLRTILEDYKEKQKQIIDIKIDQGNLEQHFIDIAKGGK